MALWVPPPFLFFLLLVFFPLSTPLFSYFSVSVILCCGVTRSLIYSLYFLVTQQCLPSFYPNSCYIPTIHIVNRSADVMGSCLVTGLYCFYSLIMSLMVCTDCKKSYSLDTVLCVCFLSTILLHVDPCHAKLGFYCGSLLSFYINMFIYVYIKHFEQENKCLFWYYKMYVH